MTQRATATCDASGAARAPPPTTQSYIGCRTAAAASPPARPSAAPIEAWMIAPLTLRPTAGSAIARNAAMHAPLRPKKTRFATNTLPRSRSMRPSVATSFWSAVSVSSNWMS